MEEREGRRKRERKNWREGERNRGQTAQIRRQSELISQGEDFMNKWTD